MPTSSPERTPGSTTAGMRPGWPPPLHATEATSDPTVVSWAQLVAEHRAFVLRRAHWLTRDLHAAEDLTQDVLLRAFGALDTYVPGGHFLGWLSRITTNLFIDQQRRRKRIRFDALSESLERQLRSAEPDPADVVTAAVVEPALQAALNALPPHFREAVILCDVRGLSYKHVAAELGLKETTLRTRVHRGRARLRASLTVRAPAPSTDPSLGQSRDRR